MIAAFTEHLLGSLAARHRGYWKLKTKVSVDEEVVVGFKGWWEVNIYQCK